MALRYTKRDKLNVKVCLKNLHPDSLDLNYRYYSITWTRLLLSLGNVEGRLQIVAIDQLTSECTGGIQQSVILSLMCLQCGAKCSVNMRP